MSLATKLVTLRKEKGLTQMELAERLNVSRQAVSRWEVGAAVPSTENLKVLSELFETTVDYLLGDSDESYREIEDEQNQSSVKVVADIHKREQRILLSIIVVLLLVLTLIISYLLIPRADKAKPVPISQMSEDTNYDDYATYAFNLE